MNPFRRYFSLFLLGAVVGPLGDASHVISGTLAYPQGAYPLYFFGMPYWTPLLFGAAACLMGAVAGAGPGFSRARAIAAVAAFFGIYALSGFLPHASRVADGMLAALALAHWWTFDRTRVGLGLAVAAAVGGTAFEALLVRQGVFSYLDGSAGLYGVPSWLPWIYVAASVAVGGFARSLRAPAAVPRLTLPAPLERRSA
jgi:hypothetical protein